MFIKVVVLVHSADLFLVDLESIAVCHIQRLGAIGRVDTASIEQKPDTGNSLPLTFAESRHELAQLSRALDLEENLIVVVGDLDVEMFGRRVFWLAHAAGGIVLGHLDRLI